MSVLEAVILGLVQGLTEFLPISSSGHLVLANHFFGFGEGGESLELAVSIATNTGTLLAVLLLLWRDVATAASGFLRGLVSAPARREEGWHLAQLVLVGSIPTAVVGLFLREYFEVLNAPLPVAIGLAVTGLILWVTPGSGPKRHPRELGFRDALIGGLAQGFAVIPGISRSGTTIATLMARGGSGDLAARFSFLLYLVVSTGVAFLGVFEVRAAQIPWPAVVAMIVASFVSGYLALRWLFSLLRRGRFRIFAPYLWLVAALTLLSLWLG